MIDVGEIPHEEISIIPSTPEALIQEAEAEGLIYKPLHERIEREVEVVTKALSLAGIISADQEPPNIFDLRAYCGDLIESALIEGAKRRNPGFDLDRRIENPESNTNDILHEIISDENLFLTEEGTPTSLQDYIKERYAFLLQNGLTMEFKSLTYDELITLLPKVEYDTDLTELSALAGTESRISVVTLMWRDEIRIVPIISAQGALDRESAGGLHSTKRDSKGNITYEVINIGVRNGSIHDIAQVVCHEIDHSIYSLTYTEKSRKAAKKADRLNRAAAALDEFRSGICITGNIEQDIQDSSLIEKIDKKYFELRDKSENISLESDILSSSRILNTFIYEGLARRAENDFLLTMARRLSTAREDLQLPVAATLLTDIGALFDQLYSRSFLYGAGYVLTSLAIKRSSLLEAYTSDRIESDIAHSPFAIKTLVRHFIGHLRETCALIDKLCHIEEISSPELERLHQSGQLKETIKNLMLSLKGYGTLVFGKDYHALVFDQTRAIRDMSETERIKQINVFFALLGQEAVRVIDALDDKSTFNQLLTLHNHFGRLRCLKEDALYELVQDHPAADAFKPQYSWQQRDTSHLNVPRYDTDDGHKLTPEEQLKAIKEAYPYIELTEIDNETGEPLTAAQQINALSEMYPLVDHNA